MIRAMKNIFILLTTGAAMVVAQAQINPGVNQSDTTRAQRATEKALPTLQPGDVLPALYDGESEDVGPQSVLRVKKNPWLRASVDVQAFYTDNMLYTEQDKEDAGVAITTVEGALMTKPYITRFASYRGEFVNGKRSGHGIGVFVVGLVWSGEWRDDEACGAGVLEAPDGRRFEGAVKPDAKGEPRAIDGQGWTWNVQRNSKQTAIHHPAPLTLPSPQ